MPLDLHIDRDALVEHLGHANRVIERKPGASPALLCVRLVATDEGLVLTATDTELAYRGTVACAVASPGALALDARELFQMARSLPEPTVRIRTAPLGKAEVRSGRSKFRMSAMPTDDLPPLPSFDGGPVARLRGADLARLVSCTAFSVATDDARYGLNGVHVEHTDEVMRMVSTDGHRMSIAERPYEGEVAMPPRTLIPRKALAVMEKLLADVEDEVEVAFARNDISVALGEHQFWFRLLDGQFPDYKAMVPSSTRTAVRAAKRDLLATLKRVLLLSGKQQATAFAFGEAELEVQFDRGSELTESVPVEVDGDQLTVGFDATYLRDAAARVLADQVEVAMTEPLSPAMVRDPDDEGVRFVIMPMRLG